MNIKEQRANARKRMRDVTKKISRLKSVYGTQLSGTEFDPRINLNRLSRLNGRQVTALIKRLDAFMSRDVQFVPDAKGRVMKADTYRKYVRTVQRYNRRVRASQRSFDDVFLESSGMTVGERRAMRTPLHPHMHDPVVNVPRELKPAKPSHFQSDKGLQRRLESMERRLDPLWNENRIAGNRETLQKLLDIISDDRIDNMVNGLSDTQFDFLWNNTRFVDDVSLKYDLAMTQLQGESGESWFSDSILDNVGELQTMISDARKIE